MSFQDEITRLRNILHQDYLQPDPTLLAIRCIHINPIELQTVIARELQELKARQFNTINIHLFLPLTTQNMDSLNDFLNLLGTYGFKAHLTLQTPPYGYHQDPLDHWTLPELESMMDMITTRFGNDQRIWAWDISSEVIIKPEHISDFKAFLAYFKTKVTQKVTIAFDDQSMIQAFYNEMDFVNIHFYFVAQLRNDDPAKPHEILDTALTYLKTLGTKEIYIGEIGFPTWHAYPSNTENSPYRLPDIVATTPETEGLQYDYLANCLHIIKKHGILGFSPWEWSDDISDEGTPEGGYGIKTQFPELRAKKAMELFPKLSAPSSSAPLIIGASLLLGLAALAFGGD